MATSSNYPALFESAGFADVDRVDVTSAYRATAAAWLAQRERRADDIIALVGAETHGDKLTDSRDTVAAIDDGLLRRYLYVAARKG